MMKMNVNGGGRRKEEERTKQNTNRRGRMKNRKQDECYI
jgi:hypothetical protein